MSWCGARKLEVERMFFLSASFNVRSASTAAVSKTATERQHIIVIMEMVSGAPLIGFNSWLCNLLVLHPS